MDRSSPSSRAGLTLSSPTRLRPFTKAPGGALAPFRERPEHELADLDEEKLVAYIVAARDQGELDAATAAAQILACLAELPIDPARLNVNGGAIALGHPLGCTGARLTATLLHEMKRRQGRYGLVSMCVGGGMGAAGIFERMS